MNDQTFSLQPFASADLVSGLKIAGNIARNANLLIISYAILGNIQEVVIAPPSNTPSRKHGLWENTCFEFFVGIQNSDKYWEFNLSPSSDWNVYRFDGYRQGMQEETAFTTLPFSVQYSSDCLAIALDIDLDKIVSEQTVLDVAITTVIKHSDDTVTYWALTHLGVEADFHLRDSFIIKL
ncbi:MAG: DOMON-like domain-containing protein [Cyanomargarita calcarea GSE-NOS-MK-12-04C]|uniref:DOMON-like domain-containing protein n=1 Tax=Cyanomargarita calcarea GSE-NOS-MK-12-04C TaxID=2839659 RepID=A0A951UTG9_9CYAN|nr:DOMON-like domain-containing protein [Cyanomargarita calcarea GSE-NOS-MK-12-04C]